MLVRGLYSDSSMQCDSALKHSLEVIPSLIFIEVNNDATKLIWEAIKKHLVGVWVPQDRHRKLLVRFLVDQENDALCKFRLIIHH